MPENPTYTNILYIDDEVHNLNAFKAAFRREFNIFLAENTIVAKKILDEQEIHVLITDQRMPGMLGTEFLASIIDQYPDCIRILLTGYADINAVIDAINQGQVYKYLQKPWKEEELKSTILKAIELYTIKRKGKTLTDQLLLSNEQLEFLLRQNLLS
ncbi:MAG TPA: response regulator [Niabella sp.]|nr:response regulator [Niabella sp.]HQW14575.1 response regulator [Niabella sp.]HQX19716.1 response regulator [Niabella sp.]HQX42875.1 response regulator [Niabella sp.]HRB07547.1 response regulator [Niabella sp.]